jgi:hypothetical protein
MACARRIDADLRSSRQMPFSSRQPTADASRTLTLSRFSAPTPGGTMLPGPSEPVQTERKKFRPSCPMPERHAATQRSAGSNRIRNQGSPGSRGNRGNTDPGWRSYCAGSGKTPSRTPGTPREFLFSARNHSADGFPGPAERSGDTWHRKDIPVRTRMRGNFPPISLNCGGRPTAMPTPYRTIGHPPTNPIVLPVHGSIFRHDRLHPGG